MAFMYGVVNAKIGFSKQLVIESKAFVLTRDGSSLHIIKRSWRVVKDISLGRSTMLWFAKTLEESLKGERKYF